MASDSTSSSDSQPSMIGGHLKYAQGAISSALGYDSGETTKSEAVQELKDANNASKSTGPEGQAPTQNTILGKVEKAAGSVTGCEGMAGEGAKRIPDKRGIEEQTGTG